jgi:hypothetical protein
MDDLAMRNTADVTGGKPIAVWLQSISGGDAVNPLVAFYDIHGRKRGAIFLFCPGHHKRLVKIRKYCTHDNITESIAKLLSFEKQS